MKQTTVIVDVSNLSHRNWHAMGGQSRIHNPILFGMMRDIITMRSRFGARQFVFCFDGELPQLSRRLECSTYKACRKPTDHTIHQQINMLRNEILPALGFLNILYQYNAEADDQIANCVGYRKPGNQYVIASGDHDLYQLLFSDRVLIYQPQPKLMVSEDDVFQRFQVWPAEWALFKALTGCDSDNVIGIDGVGPVTAASYIRESLPKTHAAFGLIAKSQDVLNANLSLTTLPHGKLRLGMVKLKEDEVDKLSWNDVCYEHDMVTLVDKWEN